MANCLMLKELIKSRGLKQRYIAKGIGVTDKRIHELLNGGRWKLDEVISICRLLSLTKKQREAIFFDEM